MEPTLAAAGAGIFERLGGTLLLRPYVVAFLAAFLLVALASEGWRRTALWLASGYLLAFLSEVSAIHNGFPYGPYQYVLETRERELWTLGEVPLFDSLSYVFLCYAGFAVARLLTRPLSSEAGGLRGLSVGPAPSRALAARTWLVGAVLVVLLDIVIDPVATMGERWFLGRVHVYPGGGSYFGVPLANFGGWLLTALAIVGVNVWLDGRLSRPPAALARRVPYLVLGGAGIYFGVLGFMLAMTAKLALAADGAERLRLLGLLACSLAVTGGVAAALATRLRRAAGQISPPGREEREAAA